MISKRLAFLCLAISLCSLPGCLRVGQASRDELAQLDYWGKLLPDRDRAAVQREADQHTDWMPKKKVQWMTMQYRARYRRAQAASQPSTGPTTVPTTVPTPVPTTVPTSSPTTTRGS
jgi:hypothetical protein